MIFRASYVYNPIHFLDNSVILYMVSDYQDKRSEAMEAYTNFAEVYDCLLYTSEMAIRKGRSCGMSNQEITDLFNIVLED